MNPCPPPNEPIETDSQINSILDCSVSHRPTTTKLTHIKLIAREVTLQQTLFYSNPVEVIFVSLCDDTNE